MKFIHCADIHLGSSMQSRLPKDKAEERQAEVRTSFSSMVQYAEENGIKAILLSGDVFDSDMPLKGDKEYFYNVIRAHSDIDFLYLRGNHDVKASYDVYGLVNLKTFSDEWQTYSYGGVDISGIETENGNLPAIYPSLKLQKDRINIVMLHGQDGDGNNGTINIAALRGKNIDYLALGHIHTYSAKKLDDRGVYVYSGCLEGRGFDETGVKGFVEIDIQDGISYSFIPRSRRVIHEIPVDITASTNTYDASVIVGRSLAGIKSCDILRVVLKGEIDYDGAGLAAELEKSFFGKYYFFSVKDVTLRRIDTSALAGDMTLKGEFMRAVMESDGYSEEEKKEIILLGLKALGGREV